MDTSQVEEFYCPRCRGPVAAEDRFCRHCAAPLGGNPSPDAAARPITQQRWFVLLMLFAALGPLALPMLWHSEAFSPTAKVGLTVAVVLLTVVVIGILWVYVWWIVHQLAPLRDLRSI